MKPFLVKRSCFLLVFLIIFCLVSSFFAGCEKQKQTGPPPPEVLVADVIQKDVPIYSEWVGTLDGLVNATIQAQVTGYLIKQNYREGELVKKGQVLFEIDPRSFEATVGEAKAQLAQAEARWQTTKANLARVKPLAAQNAVSKKDLDDAIGAEAASYASVIGAKAALDKARLNLEWTRIISPIDGIAGIAKAQIGDLVGTPQRSELTTVSTVDPIKVYISLSEQEYLSAMEIPIERRGKMPLEVILADGRVYPYKGVFAFTDRQVDIKTGTILVGALFKNPEYLLRPGQFARLRAEVNVKHGALLVPQRAITELQGNYLVAVVDADGKVAIRLVKPAEIVDTFRVIDAGLKPGERIVVEGTQKVKEGMRVTPKPFGVGSGANPRTLPKVADIKRAPTTNPTER